MDIKTTNTITFSSEVSETIRKRILKKIYIQFKNSFWVRKMFEEEWKFIVKYDESDYEQIKMNFTTKKLEFNAKSNDKISKIESIFLYTASLTYLQVYYGIFQLFDTYIYEYCDDVEMRSKVIEIYLSMLTYIDFTSEPLDLSAYKHINGYLSIAQWVKGNIGIESQELLPEYIFVNKTSEHRVSEMHIDKVIEELEQLPKKVFKYLFEEDNGYIILFDLKDDELATEESAVYYADEKMLVFENLRYESYYVFIQMLQIFYEYGMSVLIKEKITKCLKDTPKKDIISFLGFSKEEYKEKTEGEIFSFLVLGLLTNFEEMSEKIGKITEMLDKYLKI